MALLCAVAAACGLLGPGDPFEQLEFSAQAEIAGDTVYDTPTVLNRSAEDVELTSHCSEEPGVGSGWFFLRVYDLPSGGGHLRWDGNRLPPGVICAIHPLPFRVLAGEQVAFEWWLEISTILGDSLPDGAYRLAVAADFDHWRPDEVSVGQFTLVRSEGPR